MTFADKMRVASDEKKIENEKTELDAKEARKAVWEARKSERDAKKAVRDQNDAIKANEVRDGLFVAATTKYHDNIKRGIKNASDKAMRVKRINFDRNDFKGNCNGCGYPVNILAAWLVEMCNPDSKYLPVAEETTDYWTVGEKMHFEGVKCEALNNNAFTVVFTW
jgi:hypothetical protein